MRLKKLIVPTASSEERTIGEEIMNRAPAVTAPLSVLAGGSVVLVRTRKNAEPRNDSASASTAIGADSNCTSTPPMLGPATYDSARLPWISELPSTYPSDRTSDWNKGASLTLNSTLSVPARH